MRACAVSAGRRRSSAPDLTELAAQSAAPGRGEGRPLRHLPAKELLGSAAARGSSGRRQQPAAANPAGGGAAACSALSAASAPGAGAAAAVEEDRAAVAALRADLILMQRRLDSVRPAASDPRPPGAAMLNLEAWLARQEAACDPQRLRLRLTEVYLVKAAQLAQLAVRQRGCGATEPSPPAACRFTDPCDPGAPPTSAPLAHLLALSDPPAADSAGDVEAVARLQREKAELQRSKEALERECARLRVAAESPSALPEPAAPDARDTAARLRGRAVQLEQEYRQQGQRLGESITARQALEQELAQLRDSAAASTHSRHAEQELRKELAAVRRERNELEDRLGDCRRTASSTNELRSECEQLREELRRERRGADALRASLAEEAMRAQRAEQRAQMLEAAAAAERKAPPLRGPQSPRFGRRAVLGCPGGSATGRRSRSSGRSGGSAFGGRLSASASPLHQSPEEAPPPHRSTPPPPSCCLDSSTGSALDEPPAAPPIPDDGLGRDVAAVLDEHYASLSESERRSVAAAVRRDLEGALGQCDGLFDGAVRDLQEHLSTASASAQREQERLRGRLAASTREAQEARDRLQTMQQQFKVGCSLVSETKEKTEQLSQRLEDRSVKCEAMERENQRLQQQLAADRARSETLQRALRSGSGAQQQILELQRELDNALTARLRLQGCLDDKDMQRENFDSFLMEELRSMRDAFAIKLRLASQEVEAMKQRHREVLAEAHEEAAREQAALRQRLREAQQHAEHLERRLRP
eukprot:TRINITY_DN3233_c3_g1_i1.p1 TRINITY_DN3233_c3_g1~~TRINITY_DN3233_c3_g1_i1.p1  ORF type:complete len:785 (+),score=302.57 TRINITY_DN3233_c3_g1_i1:73-2355(+)